VPLLCLLSYKPSALCARCTLLTANTCALCTSPLYLLLLSAASLCPPGVAYLSIYRSIDLALVALQRRRYL
jgi:hypothetical protein